MRLTPKRRPWLLGVLAALILSALFVPPAAAQTTPEEAPAPAGAATTDPVAPDVVRYGVGLRMPRWVTVPSWFLGLFHEENVPLSTFG